MSSSATTSGPTEWHPVSQTSMSRQAIAVEQPSEHSGRLTRLLQRGPWPKPRQPLFRNPIRQDKTRSEFAGSDRRPKFRSVIIIITIAGSGGGCHGPSLKGGSDSTNATSSTEEPGTHGHRAGTHGGLIVPIDGAHYHVEAILTGDGEFRLLTLGENEARVQEVESQTLTAYVRPRDEMYSSTVELGPVPQHGDSPGTTSAFVGRIPKALAERPLVVVVPNIRIAGQRLRFGFEMEPGSPDAMPEKVADEDERRLYLTPGGKYTDADIAANGRMTASTKFAGFHASHDPHPTPGARTCPITDTLANPNCSWIIGGSTYTFCCPPCVDEFVRRAKEQPDSIRKPEEYVAPGGVTP